MSSLVYFLKPKFFGNLSHKWESMFNEIIVCLCVPLTGRNLFELRKTLKDKSLMSYSSMNVFFSENRIMYF
jgi:hypothetical protein